ncbi:MAG: methionine--tRNA ligase [Thermoproteota archaeon]|nr:MAG: methionine--tRNA ligase [Candidatus Korarchaeota archaeon]
MILEGVVKLKTKWVVTCAWPYINTVPHLGTLIGSLLSADIYARYLRHDPDNEVIFVSGSDEHGTPIEVEARKMGVDPRELTDKYHEIVKELIEKFRISFDNYSRTESETHKKFVRKFYRKIYERGYIFTKDEILPFCNKCNIYLPDRFVEGRCPHCGYEYAKGDQCENCGRLLDPKDLINPKCTFCGSKPSFKKSKHWYFDLPAFEKELKTYIEGHPRLPSNVKNMSLSMIREGLKPRSLTRDNKWGISAPFPGAENKTIYVWMEAVLGYISAVIEYFEQKGNPERWREFWLSKDTKTLFFIGKDNIPFHIIVFPALLLASGDGYPLPWQVSSTEFLMYEGQKFSKSRRIGIWLDQAIKLLPSDYWRFYLTLIRPETSDSNFSWGDFQRKINNELNDTLGNLIHRTLSFINRYFNSEIPNPSEMTEEDKALLKTVKETTDIVSAKIEEFKFRDALVEVLNLARKCNSYFNMKEPWKLVKTDKGQASTSLYILATAIKTIAIIMEPFLPDTAEKIWETLDLPGNIHTFNWSDAYHPISPGKKIKRSKPLFTKVDVEKLKSELSML